MLLSSMYWPVLSRVEVDAQPAANSSEAAIKIPKVRFMSDSLGVAVDDAVDDLHLVADAPWGCGCLGDHAVRAVVEAHRDLEALGALHLLLDLIAKETAGDRADDRPDLAAVA